MQPYPRTSMNMITEFNILSQSQLQRKHNLFNNLSAAAMNIVIVNIKMRKPFFVDDVKTCLKRAVPEILRISLFSFAFFISRKNGHVILYFNLTFLKHNLLKLVTSQKTISNVTR